MQKIIGTAAGSSILVNPAVGIPPRYADIAMNLFNWVKLSQFAEARRSVAAGGVS